MMLAKHDSFLGNMKSFIANTVGCVPDQVDEADCELVVGDQQPLAGVAVHVKPRNITTKAGSLFTAVNYLNPVSARELAEMLTEQERETFYPGDALNRLIQVEEQQAKQQEG